MFLQHEASSILRILFQLPPLHSSVPQQHTMIDFSKRITTPELMDDPNCDEILLFRTLDQFRIVNRLFSRYQRLLTKTILQDMQPGRTYHLVDVGAGGCDIPAWLLTQAQKKGLSLRITALDTDPRITRHAQKAYSHLENLSIVNDSGEHLEKYAPIDYVFANHVLHHLDDDTIRTFIQTSTRLANRGVIFSDLKRSRWSYIGFSIAALVFRHSFTRSDGLLSIRRGFLPAELADFADSSLTVQTLHPGRVNLVSNAFTA